MSGAFVPRLAIVALTSLLPLGCAGQSNPPSKGRDVAKLYADQCARCHGPDMTGGSAPALVGNKWRFGGDDPSIARSMRNGHPDAGMPAMGGSLNEAEIRGLVVYLHERGSAYDKAKSAQVAVQLNAPIHSEVEAFKLEPVIESGLVEPWSLAFLPDGRMLVTERAGRLRIIDGGKLVPEPVRGTPPVFGGEGGLLDVAIHPKFSQPGNGWIYLSYGDKSADGNGMTAILRGRLRDGALVETQQIFKADPSAYRPGGQRFGSRLLFDEKGHLFFSIGDRAHPGDEQDLSHPNGKIHRVFDDGSIPKDNPFVGRPGALPSIWSYGHRNPQGLVFSPVTGELWEAEHGPRGGDELNRIERGHNYGWPVITYGINYDGTPITDHLTQAGMDQPVSYWVPSIATGPIAFYTGTQFGAWKNNLLLGSLATQQLRRLEIDGDKVTHQEILFEGIGRVRDIVNGPDGNLYVVLDSPDRIVRVTPAKGAS